MGKGGDQVQTYQVLVAIYGRIETKDKEEAQTLLEEQAKEFAQSKGLTIDDYSIYVNDLDNTEPLNLDV
jgi:uncharacterized lipoprotein YehR (DUF1307 family)